MLTITLANLVAFIGSVFAVTGAVLALVIWAAKDKAQMLNIEPTAKQAKESGATHNVSDWLGAI